MGAGLAVDAAVVALLVWIAREDSLRFRIPNRLVLALALACPAAFLLQGRADLLVPHGLFALAALAVLFGGFAAGICGGGDVKLLATALLWIGPEGTFVFAVLLLPAVVAYALGARLRLLPARRDGRRLRIPLGPCIALAWIGVIGLSRALP
jgi:prepilin peptidase CpaA